MSQNKNLRQSYGDLQKMVGDLRGALIGLQQAYSQQATVLAAVVSLLGQDSVQEEMNRLAQEQQDAQERQMADGVKLLVDARVLKPAPETSLGVLIVGTDTSPDGKTRRVQFELKEQVVPADLLPKFLGKKPGDVVENNGVKLTVIEVYEVDKARAAEFQVEQQKKATEVAQAAQAAAAPTPEEQGGESAEPATEATEPTSSPTDEAPQA